ncbi:acyl carrier protein [Imperialibacter roseus]|uniref:Acyl carrier protein n=1 Tax=Imperialibacter roseus TaxID=1324217 RepID=A0ABZ0IK15_9BACT|nr:acyl carrier protein [Imperialibacter roseus]WOK05359.1 acyl carrier protein [Imperialibacter roseus]
MENFIEKFKEILEIDDREVKPSDSFKKFEEWDSLSRLSLIAMLDEEYGVQIEEDEFSEINTVQELIDAVKEKSK